ncbi:conserved hypothetical protein [Perkinsus marinus ATCC 50983]|uniref:RING-type domain-containing protein n=1 Tax=Perkinsus marinus (strain ATCC 50983 / TXsc) TaxID=423536 RepID=C5LDU0_PERM5|nr:conserved hypothetical protein [Perkinsus marinus ATCC 50983]EER05104.1 conserved hypothetical protein [Perkinsus marinus ATCC 50983]|eukprot:XP_002773288.1 conserved hypothetical protein [Perkinsus marinus ATCC 50983]
MSAFNSWPYISIVIVLGFAAVFVLLWYKYVERRNGRLVFVPPYQSPKPSPPLRCDTLKEQEARLQELMDKTKIVNTQKPGMTSLGVRHSISQRSILSLASLRAAVSNDSMSEIDETDPPGGGLLRAGGSFECPICLADCRDDPGVRLLPCGHCFHEDCIRAWFISQLIKPTCPLCRRPVIPPISEDTKILLTA